jgi:hypothetical protein
VDIITAREEFFKQFKGGHALIVVKIHGGNSIEKIINRCLGNLEFIYQDVGKVLAIECSGKRKLGVIENDFFQLDNGFHYLPVPVFTACLNHAVRETVKRDIKDMAFAFKPGCQASQLMVMLKQKNRVAASGKTVCGGKASKA